MLYHESLVRGIYSRNHENTSAGGKVQLSVSEICRAITTPALDHETREIHEIKILSSYSPLTFSGIWCGRSDHTFCL